MMIKPSAEFLKSITSDMITRVYSGRPGCMCGCLGSYWTNPKFKDASSSVCDTRQVSRILNRILKDPRAVLQDGYILYISNLVSKEREYVAYLYNDASEQSQTEREKIGLDYERRKSEWVKKGISW